MRKKNENQRHLPAPAQLRPLMRLLKPNQHKKFYAILITKRFNSTDTPSYSLLSLSFCLSQRTEERSIQLAVRVHKTLELADDKFYVITCGKSGYTR